MSSAAPLAHAPGLSRTNVTVNYQSTTRNTASQFLEALDQTDVAIDAIATQLDPKLFRKLKKVVDDCRRAAGQIGWTVGTVVAETPLTIVDLEGRMRRETEDLLKAAHELEEAVLANGVTENLGGELRAVEDTLQHLACALFPSSAEGLAEANESASRFGRETGVLRRRRLQRLEERGELDDERRRAIAGTLARIDEAFERTRSYVDDLAMNRLRGSAVREEYREKVKLLEDAGALARRAISTATHGGFESILDRAAELAKDSVESLGRVRAPLFPEFDNLEELKPSISEGLYRDLSGPQKFTLLNIASLMRRIAGPEVLNLVDERFEPNVWRVYTDRIYLRAKASLLTTVKNHPDFGEAPAGLHRFNEGSYKQNRFEEGNLQLSYQSHRKGLVDVDADIDLYRDPIAHFFGEVLKNHLTGSKTDQFRVREILNDRKVVPIGGFEIVTLSSGRS